MDDLHDRLGSHARFWTDIDNGLSETLREAQDRIERLEAAIAGAVETLCLRAETTSASDMSQFLWGVSEDLEKDALTTTPPLIGTAGGVQDGSEGQ